MATDPYFAFKNTYNQGIADGLPQAAALAAAQAAMQSAFDAQNSATRGVGDKVIGIPGTRLNDYGPQNGENLMGSEARGSRLGKLQK